MDIVAQRYGEEVSDHWPLSARICLGQPGVKPEALPCPRKNQLLRGASLCIDSSYAGASKSTRGVPSLQAEKELAANQRAGWRQGKAPPALEQPPEVLQLQRQREERKRAAAEAAAAAAEAAEWEMQQEARAARNAAMSDYIEQDEYESPEAYDEQAEKEPEQEPEQEFVESAPGEFELLLL